MALQDTIAQLRQDITTAEDAGDETTAERMRGELAEAIPAADQSAQAHRR
ncbi:hypothetical protein [Nocardia abscessus]|nr:hypothetical protein [Nocardia abscessus]